MKEHTTVYLKDCIHAAKLNFRSKNSLAYNVTKHNIDQIISYNLFRLYSN